MPQLDRLKEQLAYLKFWLGIVVVTDISLIGWLVSAFDSAAGVIVALALAGVASLTFVIMAIHRRIEQRIEQIGTL
jgi:hypothetical protein